ncbi:2-oxo-4-hydroxy-4-carboxy-5-ureidoimidazoline decarboxylase [Zafaria cholistanensis]|nr:2-oxo-4-hydroxy-4-carboxy-5-ureidoimidazoline decarboxylase [Zafaria cholistanensis]
MKGSGPRGPRPPFPAGSRPGPGWRGGRLDEASAAAWLAANRRYEERFGRIFLIRAAGRTGADMLARLHERLGNDPATEARVRAGQLAEIALLRLEAQVAAPSSAATFQD